MIMPYINFDGDCEEAFLWYAKIFNGKIEHMAKYGDIPENSNSPMTVEQKRKVMHAQLMLTETGGISGADAILPIEKGGVISIHAHLTSEALAQKVFSALSEGGTVLGALATNPPPDDSGVSGSVKDKHGITWIISALKST
ncbi:hypothetical protein EZS27_024031 [termite gut metagenome]|uniref:PhnB-like domain-containing protein n=1 Tax=termite gut metagenome TaxID=433724 RepID=A0A5J4R169_9ZZZZ